MRQGRVLRLEDTTHGHAQHRIQLSEYVDEIGSWPLGTSAVCLGR
jgi:hypothetical protein